MTKPLFNFFIAEDFYSCVDHKPVGTMGAQRLDIESAGRIAQIANTKHEAECPYKIIWEEWVPKYGTALNYLGEAIELAELVCKDHWHSGVKNKAREFLKKVKNKNES